MFRNQHLSNGKMQEFYGAKSVGVAGGKVLIAVEPALCVPDIRKADALHPSLRLHHIKREPDI